MKTNIQSILTAVAMLIFLASCSGPRVAFKTPVRVIAANEVSFNNTSSNAVSYQWDFGDGESSTEAMPKHRYYKSGDYIVSLTATDAKGKSKTTTSKVEVYPPKRCLVLIKTSMGDMIAELSDATPKHQDNFVKLVEQEYYNDLLFHRVINKFMIQGGDPKSRNASPSQQLGSGGPGYTVAKEFVDSLAHVKGALAAARTNNPQKASSGSQFYIVHGRSVTDKELNNQEGQMQFRYPSTVRDEYLEKGGVPFLDQNYTVFGRVIEGLDVLDRIATTPTGAGDRPKQNVSMKISLIR